MKWSPPTTPSSAISPVRRKSSLFLPGFRPPPRPKQRPIEQMTLRELQDLRNLNSKILGSPGASTSTYVERVSAEQAAIESRLIDLEDIESINIRLKNSRIQGEGDMQVESPHEPPTSRTIEAKRKALSQFALNNGVLQPNTLGLQEAIELERQAHMQDVERQRRIMERRKRMGIPIKGEVLTRQEQEARMWAFMNHKPTDSDLEDEEEEDDDEDDPASWLVDDQDDGRKGQDIIEPDTEDISDMICVDPSKLPYSAFYEPRGDGL